jgi:hypothetical protein
MPGIDCLGCHHRQPPTTHFMGCERGDLACMRIDQGAIVNAVREAESIGR